MTIRLFKLVTGEEVIGDFGEATLHGAGIKLAMAEQLTKPFQVQEMIQGQNIVLVLRPYFRGGTCDVLWIKPEHVIQSVTPSEGLLDVYRQQTSGIVVAR